ncbi:PREDICTED: AAA-ATPase At5g17760-like [Nicotiana attenuata]|uniref:Aaa-atpase n=1 Tax=Nicotiana attenuata TaxID=49451 RepID=A0A1J6IND0_NICAT|nr:PREDICTED: AAA-ATPase At5g17760-like [Nicotiana attenuata]OIT06366.1 aaa-atpase [Nicotiana attenuata]
MASLSSIPSASSMFQAYASMTASITLFKTMLNQVVPRQVQHYIVSKLRSYYRPHSSNITLVIGEKDGIAINEVYNAAEIYLSAKSSPEFQRFRVSKIPKDPKVNVKFGNCGKITDSFEGIQLVWRYVHEAGSKNSSQYGDSGRGNFASEKRSYFELSFKKQHKEKIVNCYIPFVLEKAKVMSDEKKVVKLNSLATCSSILWDSVNLEHPSTFETLALEPALKKAIIEDLDRFLNRKEFYRRVGKAWKRGYLLYGPPGTGKSSLIAAIANYLKFDIYDLDLSHIRRDSDLRKLLLSTKNRSIIVIEDIDCSVDLPERTQNRTKDAEYGRSRDRELTLGGLLNFIDGLWSSCVDERVIIFTTNHKERLDPALLRPGRMDMHVHMSYLTSESFKVLASNYLEIHDPHQGYFQEIQELIEGVQVTPAEVAEELMKSEDADVCLGGLVNFLKRKRICNNITEEVEIKDNNTTPTDEGVQLPQVKRRKPA